MILCDVNILVYAFRSDAPRHAEHRAWLVERLAGDESYGVVDAVLSSLVRVVTHPRIFQRPSTVQEAFAFCDALRSRPNAVLLAPGARHWGIFTRLCAQSAAKGNLVADAYLAALAIEWGCEWITTDRDYTRFPGLRWRDPLSSYSS